MNSIVMRLNKVELRLLRSALADVPDGKLGAAGHRLLEKVTRSRRKCESAPRRKR